MNEQLTEAGLTVVFSPDKKEQWFSLLNTNRGGEVIVSLTKGQGIEVAMQILLGYCGSTRFQKMMVAGREA